MQRALITGVTGQDGAYLSKLLLGKGYQVFGAFRPEHPTRAHRLQDLGIADRVELLPLDLGDPEGIARALDAAAPDEVYNLAAQSLVNSSFKNPLGTADINAAGCLRILETMKTRRPDARFYQASSSDMFGEAQSVPQNEATPFRPRSPYGVAKLFAHWMTATYRRAHGLFACSGILFNHESPLRSLDFVTRKITDGVARIKLGLRDRLALGNLDAERDWGFAKEYVEAMWLMLQQSKPDDYVIATGEAHTVRQFAEAAFRAAGIDVQWEGTRLQEKCRDSKTGKVLAEVTEDLFRLAEVDLLVGDATKAKRELGWAPRTRFDELVAMMVEADLARVAETL